MGVYYQKKPPLLTKPRFKKILVELLENITVDNNCPESVQKYVDLEKKTDQLYSSYTQKNDAIAITSKEAVVITNKEAVVEYKEGFATDNIQRLTSYKDEYIG